ncbi:hypothetical protein BC834DRAFT_350454 [Gloeopeniophorella convolvens]|nr:hypothetical protein BC834DRAFT_350454 [Gloeopeniophorella convolvens]
MRRVRACSRPRTRSNRERGSARLASVVHTLCTSSENAYKNTRDSDFAARKQQPTSVTMSSLSDASSVEPSASLSVPKTPGRVRKVSMKLKKGLKEVKEKLSPHHHHRDRDHTQSRKPGPYETPRGPLAPVLDRLERTHSVPIHLHISHRGSFSFSRKGSSSTYSSSDAVMDDANVLADIDQHIKAQAQPQPQPQPQAQPESVFEAAPQPPAAPESPRPPSEDETPNPFLVDDPEDPLSDPEPPTPALAPPPVVSSSDVTPAESVALSPAVSESPLPPPPAPPPAAEKPVPVPTPTSDTESEPDVPAVYLPQLVLSTMFLPIPNVRLNSHLTWWLTRRASVYY